MPNDVFMVFHPSIGCVSHGKCLWFPTGAAVEKTLQTKLEDSRQACQMRLVRSLQEYRKLFSVQHRTSNRLIYPESLKLLPLYTLAIIKNMALRGGFGDCSPDQRSAMGFQIMTMSIPRLLRLLYPSLIRLDEYLLQVIIWLSFGVPVMTCIMFCNSVYGYLFHVLIGSSVTASKLLLLY